ncbi:glutathione peroxidase [Primorskyibacter aestuariivivens]|uniref:glutathione peroxidase n=1 Tax=Primorskyibacter aestuariivivens TaxID=1888912 RepID=UPI002301A8B9|nr:glutathione peroxidase [Primorskyibacter aestuariivivens]MDA7427174.1 glutathione peroxidase [Primorskyibacter aestuariivivens]
MRLFVATLVMFVLTLPAAALERFTFPSIDGGTLDLGDWRGQPVLVVNTASQCGFTPQYDGLQALYDRYADQGLVVLAVPSDDFNQELATANEVKAFCEINFNLTLPMTDITHVRGPQAHPFYKWLRQETGFTPKWNFNKVLIGPDGTVIETYGSATRPMSRPVEAALAAP